MSEGKNNKDVSVNPSVDQADNQAEEEESEVEEGRSEEEIIAYLSSMFIGYSQISGKKDEENKKN